MVEWLNTKDMERPLVKIVEICKTCIWQVVLKCLKTYEEWYVREPDIACHKTEGGPLRVQRFVVSKIF